MSSNKPSKEYRKFLIDSRLKTIQNAEELLKDAIVLFNKGKYQRASFNAMTCIEELGKLWILRMAGFHNKTDFEKIIRTSLFNMLRNHTEKALQLAASTFYINSGADRRQGTDPKSKTVRTSGIILLVRSKKWMDWRNACVYTDVDVDKKKSFSPKEVITKEVSYYFTCMAFEALAENGESGYGSELDGFGMTSEKGIKFWQCKLKELTKFMEKNKNVNLDNIDFLSNSKKYQMLAEKIESKSGKKKSSMKY